MTTFGAQPVMYQGRTPGEGKAALRPEDLAEQNLARMAGPLDAATGRRKRVLGAIGGLDEEGAQGAVADLQVGAADEIDAGVGEARGGKAQVDRTTELGLTERSLDVPDAAAKTRPPTGSGPQISGPAGR